MSTHLQPPRTLDDVRSDGYFSALRRDYALRTCLGTSPKVAYMRTESGYAIDLIGADRALKLKGRIIGSLNADRTHITWLVPHPDFDFLFAPASDELIQAARTIFGPGLLYLAPQDDGTTDLVLAEDADWGGFLPSIDETLALGLRSLPHSIDLQRALLSFAAFENIRIRADDDVIVFENGSRVNLSSGTLESTNSLSIADVVADSFYFSVEHQLFFHGAFPQARVTYDEQTHQAQVKFRGNSINAHGIVAGFLSGDTFSFAHSSEAELLPVRAFATKYAIPELLQPTSIARAQELGLVHAVKRIVGHWTHVFIPVNECTTALVLIDAPAFHLPPYTPEAAAAARSTRLPSGVDKQRAEFAYRQLRQF
ncbi:hypothetical protein N7326_04630 [Corynebacterium sp. ES2794-CONJ1]|uniref:DUF6882 domain-containing protein n=1 Tax=unclassified Corynebacterium TaxID=2624378 RepID=UPI00216A8571|nr:MULTISPECIES: DUF6882 domain-containing protein [unclassified Corynebacterium]MCS4489980.1 hypothetical protein [Corynebacterium sp. ES2775-CONJ]MCS4491657.1 hypothetical protein [Corynebacterium sp. ES2715-CONJ3]MCS4531762.1 hypothetical protein [Corynebacterium sp. ES2730-CONJ]MCU9519158.1 hypothetical protein [Corynebacterium sp. ES2794-CONJ1]